MTTLAQTMERLFGAVPPFWTHTELVAALKDWPLPQLMLPMYVEMAHVEHVQKFLQTQQLEVKDTSRSSDPVKIWCVSLRVEQLALLAALDDERVCYQAPTQQQTASPKQLA